MANIMRVQSLNPDSMCVHLDLYLAVTFDPSGLSRNEREVIAVVVSEVNGCAYCVAHHGEALCHYWQDRERVEQAAQDFQALELPERTRPRVREEAHLCPVRDEGGGTCAAYGKWAFRTERSST